MGIINKILKTGKKEEKTAKNVEEVQIEKGKLENKEEPVKKDEKEVTKKETQPRKIETNAKAEQYKILERPLVTEKVTDLGAFKKYVFAVPTNATKNEVEKAVKSIYGVSPVKVNIVNVKGKMVRSGKKYGKRKDFRKAIVTLGGEDKIEIYEGV